MKSKAKRIRKRLTTNLWMVNKIVFTKRYNIK